MYHLKLPSQILIFFVMLLCVSTVPYSRYSLSSNEKPDDLQEADGWLVTDLSDNPFVSFTRPGPPRGLTAVHRIDLLCCCCGRASTETCYCQYIHRHAAVSIHHMEKRKCNTATCVTQRLADFLIRSSNTIGTVYVPTNVGANTYGKRDLLQSPIYLPL